ncbi:MAG: Hpt domain-containing protein, partial [Marinobacter nauticus]|nr:Hpt domain-containing protein [Marinobacter nauticus]
MDNQQQDYISDRLNVLKLRFIERLRGELAYLSGFADQVRKGHVDELALNDCRQRLHKLAGSAGTFGFPSLGEFARDLEKRLKREQKALAKGSDAQFDFLPVDENVADQLELLIGIADLDNPLSTERERSAQA